MKAKDEKTAANRRKRLAKQLAENKKVNNVTNDEPSCSGLQQVENSIAVTNSNEKSSNEIENVMEWKWNDSDVGSTPLAQSTPIRNHINSVEKSFQDEDSSRTITLDDENEFVDDPRNTRTVDEHALVVEETSESIEQFPITGRRIVKIAEVANKSKCVYAVWTPEMFFHISVDRDKKFFMTQMLPKSSSFYYNCLIPELVDPRQTRSMDLRALTIDGRVPPPEENVNENKRKFGAKQHGGRRQRST